MFLLNRWQRLFAVIAVAFCFAGAILRYVGDKPWAPAVLLGLVLCIAVSAPRAPDEPVLPNPVPWLGRHWKKLALALLPGVVIYTGVSFENARRDRIASEEWDRRDAIWRKNHAPLIRKLDAEHQTCLAAARQEPEVLRHVAAEDCALQSTVARIRARGTFRK